MKKKILIILCFCLILSLSACGNKTDNKTDNTMNPSDTDSSKQTDSVQDTDSPQTTLDITKFDYSSPSTVVEFGDVEAINDLSSKAQSFDIEEGTIVKITGLYSKHGSNTLIMQDSGNGSYEGMTMFVEGDYEELTDKTKIEITGVFVKGQYFMELHVPAENIKLVE